MFVIETNVPLPAPRYKSIADPALFETLKQLAIGHSFFVPANGVKIDTRASYYAKKLGIKLATRKDNKNGTAGVRVYRTA